MQSDRVCQESGPYGKLLVVDLDENIQIVQYQLHLLIRQRPPYLLPGYLRYRANQSQLCLDVCGLTPLDQALQTDDFNPVKGRLILHDLVNILIDAADHLLPENQFSLHPSLIFMHPDQHLQLAFWPIQSGQCEMGTLIEQFGKAFMISNQKIIEYQQAYTAGGLHQLLQQINLINTKHEASEKPEITVKSHQRGSCKLVLFSILHTLGICAVIYTYNLKTNLPMHFKLILIGYMTALFILDLVQIGTKEGVLQFLRGYRKRLFNWGRQWQEKSRKGPGKKESSHREDGQTVLLAANPIDFRMALLSEGKPGTPEENEGLRAYILVDEFLIGRDQKANDLCLSDQGIGRTHARILRRAGSFFLCDLGSRNGTSLDGRRLLKNTETPLPDQCRINFANRSFYFQAD